MRSPRRIALVCVLTVPLARVAGNFRPDDTRLDACGENYSCLQQAFGNIAYRQGAKPAITLFEERILSNEFVRADCHRIGHVIGSAAFARYDGNVAKTFAVGTSTCASGYYHGILERAFVGVNTKSKLIDVARSATEAASAVTGLSTTSVGTGSATG